MRALACLFAVLALAAPAGAQMATLGPAQIADIFCLSRVGNDEGAIAGLLTPELATLIAAAEARSVAIARDYPEDKPPLGDGVPWAGYPDYTDRCAPGAIVADSRAATVEIVYDFPGEPEAAFTDILHLARLDGRWRIDDVAYPREGSLRGALVTAITLPWR